MKVLTGKEAIEALLEGKTLQEQDVQLMYRITDNLQVSHEKATGWAKTDIPMDFFFKCKFTEYIQKPQVGDWVRVSLGNEYYTGEIYKVTEHELYAEWDKPMGNSMSIKHYWEILTPEQIAEHKRSIVFKRAGRKLNEFRENDIVFLENTGTICMVTTKSNFNGNVGVKEINKPQKWNASVKQLEPIAFAENLIALQS